MAAGELSAMIVAQGAERRIAMCEVIAAWIDRRAGERADLGLEWRVYG